MDVEGSVRVGTKLDTSGTEKDLGKLQKECEKTAQKIQEAGEKLKTVFTGMSAKQLENSLSKANKELEKLIAQQSILEEQGQAVADSYKPLYDKATSEEQRIRIDEVQDAELEPINAKWAELNAKAQEYKQQIATITAEIQRMKQAEDNKREAVEKSTKAREKESIATKKTEKQAKSLGKSGTSVAKQMSREFNRTFKRIAHIGIAMLGVESIFTMFRRAVNSAMEDNKELANQLNSIWNVLGTAITPVVKKVVDWITVAITYINELVLALTGIDYIAKSNAKALEKQAKATKEAARVAQSAGFDEQTKLSDNGSSVSRGAGETSEIFEKADIGIDTEKLNEKLAEMAGITGTALLGLGAILAFSGANIPLGIGLMAAGAAALAAEAALNWEDLSTQTTNTWDLIKAVFAGGELILGAILAFSGANIPLGIGLMLVGAATLVQEAAVNWTSVSTECSTVIEGIAAAVGGSLLALGALLAFSGGNIPLGIAMMAIGAVSLATAATLNWDDCSSNTTNQVTKIAAIVGGALLGLGAVLTFSGVNIPLGLGLMAAGAVSLASAIAVKWNGVSDETKRTIELIAGIAGAALLVLGIILLFTGAGIPLGLGLIAAGAASLATAIAPNWDFLSEKVGEVCDDIKGFFEGLGEDISRIFKNIVNGILGFIEGLVNKIIGGVNWLVKQINKIGFDVPDWVPKIGGKRFGFDIPLVNEVEIPRLAQGGIVNNPGRGVPVIAGEAGREAILPLDKYTEWMDILADKINAGEKSIIVQVMLSGKKIYEEIIKLSQRREFATNGVI